MSPVITCTEEGGKEAVRKLNSLRGNLGNASTAIAKSMVMKVQRRALENLTTYPSNLLGTQLARFASAQRVIVSPEEVSWGLPSGATTQNAKTGGTKPMSAIGLLHERGGVIKPTGENKMLRIPLPPAMTAGGLDRYEGMDFHNRQPWQKGARWFILKRGKNPIICMALSKARITVVTPMYALVYQAIIKAKWWLRRAFDAAKADFPDAAKDGMTILMRNTDGGGAE